MLYYNCRLHGSRTFHSFMILSLTFKIIDTLDCDNYRSCTTTFTLFPPSCCLINITTKIYYYIAFLSFLAGLGVDKDSFLLIDILGGRGGGVEEIFQDKRQNRHMTKDKQTRRKCAVPSLFLTECGNGSSSNSRQCSEVGTETVLLPVVKSNCRELRSSQFDNCL